MTTEVEYELQQQFNKLQNTGKLYRSSFRGSDLVNLYLSSFEDDPVFRDPDSSTHNCNNCKNFLKRYANIVAIDDDNTIISMFDFEPTEKEFIPVFKALSSKLRTSPVECVFIETYKALSSLPYEKCNKSMSTFKLGVDVNYKQFTPTEANFYPRKVSPSRVYEFKHLSVSIDKKFINFNNDSAESIASPIISSNKVFNRAMEEIPADTYQVVIDLIHQKSLLNADGHIEKLKTMKSLKKEYDSLEKNVRLNWSWRKSIEIPFPNFRSELIGTVCVDISDGVNLDKVCLDWNKRSDPANYKRAVKAFTESMKRSAMETVINGGYEDSFRRRFATIDDIKSTDIKYYNSGEGIKRITMFDNLKTPTPSSSSPSFTGIKEVPIETFMKDILPNVESVEVFLENRHTGNFLSLTTSEIPDSKPMFKWDNNYIATHIGNLSGKSELSQAVESKGGRIDGVFRFSHSWNHDGQNQSLMDLHVFMPECTDKYSHNASRRRVGWNRRNDSETGGSQDVDFVKTPGNSIPVENITFPDLSKLPDGIYRCVIHNWSERHPNTSGGKCEIAFNGSNEVYEYDYPVLKNKKWCDVAEVTLKNGKFSIKHILTPKSVDKEVYNLKTKRFHKVNLVCLSPGHWGSNSYGVKYYYFMLENCKPDGPIKTYHADALVDDLYKERRVLEPLAATMMLDPIDDQLSGIGFNSTVADDVILKLKGSVNRTIKVKF